MTEDKAWRNGVAPRSRPSPRQGAEEQFSRAGSGPYFFFFSCLAFFLSLAVLAGFFFASFLASIDLAIRLLLKNKFGLEYHFSLIKKKQKSYIFKKRRPPHEICRRRRSGDHQYPVIWEKATGRPICKALVWQDTRTAGICTGIYLLIKNRLDI